jgi:hypothetical protein
MPPAAGGGPVRTDEQRGLRPAFTLRATLDLPLLLDVYVNVMRGYDSK